MCTAYIFLRKLLSTTTLYFSTIQLFDEQTYQIFHAIGGNNFGGSVVGKSVLPVEVQLLICPSPV
jgi:hypothetical protein